MKISERTHEHLLTKALSEELILAVLKQPRHRLAERAKLTTSDVPQLEKEAVRLRTERSRLVQALASTDQKHRNPEDARQVLAPLFETPLNVTPVETAEGRCFWIEGAAVVGRMLATDAGCLNSASPAGFEPA
ncbi:MULTISPECIES: hypothetical protein [Sorangium]|uniref:Uncharacterized protein n=1 Tax=Sorangium atrum TaxID=2995308 RepID=A0ABT5BPY3_9BACT|nr:hypothetical protein [Sorangium aterium]MDC0676216.1 hypothetical protein [Sorangium aterium]